METIKYTNSEANRLDREAHKLSGVYSMVRIKTGLELAQRLYEIEQNKLYLKMDEKAYPNFSAYISSMGMSYHAIRQLISIYQTFVLVGGYSIEELSEVSYHKLYIIKSELFDKKDGVYVMSKSKAETNKWMADAKSDLSINDLKQKKREVKVGNHKHEFEVIKYNQCVHCGLKTKF